LVVRLFERTEAMMMWDLNIASDMLEFFQSLSAGITYHDRRIAVSSTTAMKNKTSARVGNKRIWQFASSGIKDTIRCRQLEDKRCSKVIVI
jgi:hypothetical protein